MEKSRNVICTCSFGAAKNKNWHLKFDQSSERKSWLSTIPELLAKGWTTTPSPSSAASDKSSSLEIWWGARIFSTFKDNTLTGHCLPSARRKRAPSRNVKAMNKWAINLLECAVSRLGPVFPGHIQFISDRISLLNAKTLYGSVRGHKLFLFGQVQRLIKVAGGHSRLHRLVIITLSRHSSFVGDLSCSLGLHCLGLPLLERVIFVILLLEMTLK